MSALLENSSVERLDARTGYRGDSRPRVLHFITSFDIGGTERQCVELLHRLSDDRFDVRVAVLQRRGALLEKILPRFPVLPEFPLTNFYNANAVRQIVRLRRLLKKERIAILHAHDFYSGVLGAAAARLTNVRVIAAQRHLRLSERIVHEAGQRITHKLAHKILVNSEAIRDHIVSESHASPHKIVVIHNGLNVAQNIQELRAQQQAYLRHELNLRDEAVIIGSVARLQPVKGHQYLIEAAARVIASEPQAHFVLVGDGALRVEISQQANALGIAGHVHLLGDRNDSALIAAGFDLAVLASLHEGLPNAVMEAMAMAVPVVATAVGGTRELIREYETGFLVQPANPEALAERINFALSHPEQTELIGLRGRRHILDKFNMQRMVESVENLYMEMLGSKQQ